MWQGWDSNPQSSQVTTMLSCISMVWWRRPGQTQVGILVLPVTSGCP